MADEARIQGVRRLAFGLGWGLGNQCMHRKWALTPRFGGIIVWPFTSSHDLPSGHIAENRTWCV